MIYIEKFAEDYEASTIESRRREFNRRAEYARQATIMAEGAIEAIPPGLLVEIKDESEGRYGPRTRHFVRTPFVAINGLKLAISKTDMCERDTRLGRTVPSTYYNLRLFNPMAVRNVDNNVDLAASDPSISYAKIQTEGQAKKFHWYEHTIDIDPVIDYGENIHDRSYRYIEERDIETVQLFRQIAAGLPARITSLASA